MSPELTDEQARELGDTYFSSDPLSYFASRISGLLHWYDTAPIAGPVPGTPDRGARAEFDALLQRPLSGGPYREVDVHAQVASDSLMLRHHAAEALVRLAWVRLRLARDGGGRCLWSDLALSPTATGTLIEELNESARHHEWAAKVLLAFVPPRLMTDRRSNSDVVDACGIFLEWLDFATRLLAPAEINQLAGVNKAKHGLAVRARADMRLTFTTTPPNPDGTVPLSAFDGSDAIDIFDQPVLEVLARGPRVDGHTQGLEVTQLRLKPSTLLAEAFMMATTHAALFHVAASSHFNGREGLREHLVAPPYPGLPLGGPRPKHIDHYAPLGLRWPVTLPPSGKKPGRPGGIGFRDRFVPLHMDYANRMSGVVVDD